MHVQLQSHAGIEKEWLGLVDYMLAHNNYRMIPSYYQKRLVRMYYTYRQSMYSNKATTIL